MDYLEILKRSFQITIKNKFLWLFGFLVALSGGGGSINQNYQVFSDESNKSLKQLGEFFSTYLALIILIGIIILLIGLVIWVLGLISRGALVGAVKKIDQAEETSLGDGFSIGLHYFWRILGLSLLIGFIILILGLIFLGPGILFIILAVMGKKAQAVLMIFAAIAALCAGIFLMILLVSFFGLILIYALRFIVIDDEKVFASVKSAFNLFAKNWKESLIMFLLLLVIGMAVSIGLGVIGLILIFPLILFLISGIVFKNFLVIIPGVLGLIIAILVMAFLSGIYKTFHSTTWTLTYLRLRQLSQEQA